MSSIRIASALLVALLSASASAQHTTRSPARVAVDRASAEFDAAARAIPRDADGTLELDRATTDRLRPLACRWALAVAALSPSERRAIERRAGDSYDPRAGADGALVGVLACDDPLDIARVRHALAVPAWVRPLLDVDAAHRAAAAAFEATLSPTDAALVAAVRAAQDDVRRLESSRAADLAVLVSELTGQRCRSTAATLEQLGWEGGEAIPAVPGISALECEAPFVPDFGIAYGLEAAYCDNVSYPRAVFLVHNARGRFRVITELAQSEEDSWSGFGSGERFVAIASSRGAVLFEIETANADAVHHREIVVCSRGTQACRWVLVATGEAASDYTLTDTTLRVGAVTVSLRDWLAGSGPSFGRADRTHDFSVPFRWAQREESGARNTEAQRCAFVVRDADGTLNVRSEPDQRSRVLGTIPSGSEIRAVWSTRAWLRIEQPIAGWIYRGATERRCAR